MKNYHFKYGGGGVDLPLPDSPLIQVLQGRETPALPDIRSALFESLNTPVNQQPLRGFLQPGDQVTLIISDMSRFWMRQDLVIPHLIDYMNQAGVPDQNIVILVATGTHLGGDEAELRTLVTDPVFDRVRVENHDCRASDLVYLRTTSRGTEVWVNPLAVGRKVVALGAVTQHVMAGFGGGRKSILPGVAGLKTIQQNHAHSLDPNAARSNPAIGNAVLQGNPLHEDMCEAAAMIEQLFVVNLLMNPEMKLARIISGHWLDSWLQACEAVTAMYQVPIPALADVVIASSGGYPKDMSLYQGTKTIDNVESGLKNGGTLVLLMECREGGGAPEYFDWIKPLVNGTLDAELRANFTIPGYIFYLNCEQARRYQVLMLTQVSPEQVAPMGIEAYATPEALLAQLDLTGKRTYVIPNGSTVIPTLHQEAEQ